MNAHNISPWVRRRRFLEEPVSTFLECDLVLVCGNCGLEKTLSVGVVIPSTRRSLTLGHVIQRLRCRLPNCGGRPSSVTVKRGGYEVPITGPKARS